MERFVTGEAPEWIELGGGQRRKIRATNKDIMLVEVGFDAGSVGKDHSHPHAQISYCLSGEFTYHIEDVEYVLRPGDSIAVEGGKVHGCTCVKEGILLDVFTPVREDFLK